MRGAGLGNASITIIESVLDKEFVKNESNDLSKIKSEDNDYEFNLHKHWKGDKNSNDDDGSIKHFQD